MDDRALIEAWSHGDRRAGDAFVRRHFEPVWRYIRNKLPHEVADATQDTFARCSRYQTRIGAATSVRAYVLTIARNVVLERIRQREPVAHPVGSSLARTTSSPSSKAAGRQLRGRLRIALEHLPTDLRDVLELHYWGGLVGTELAQALHVPEGTMRSRLRRARSALRLALETA